MPIWVVFLLVYLCIVTVTGVYTLRQNGRNGHRNGNGNGHTISQMTKMTEHVSSDGSPPLAGKKSPNVVISNGQSVLLEEEIKIKTSALRNENPLFADEEPHDHPEDQQEPSPALRERRRIVVRSREDEEEDGDDEQSHPDISTVPESIPEPIEDQHKPNKIVTIETGTQKDRQYDEDVTDTLIVKKDAETQTTVFQSDKGIEVRPEVMDEEVQNSPVRENQTTQAMPSTQDIGTGEWLALQKSIGVGNHIDVEDKSIDLLLETAEKGAGDHLETEDKAIHVCTKQEDKSIQEEPEKESKEVGSYPASFHDESVQINPDAEDKSVQEVREYFSIGVGTDKKEIRDQSLQILPSLQDKEIQKDISRISVGIQNFNVFGEDKSIQAQEERISISLSSLPKLKPFFFSEEEKFDLSKSLSLSLSRQHSQNFLDEIQTVKSEILLSPKSRGIQEEEIEEPFFYPILQKKKFFHIEDVSLEVSVYPSMNKSLVESEVIENSILEKSRVRSLKKSKSHKEIEDMSFEILEKSSKSAKKKSVDDLSFEILEKASRKSSFVILSDEENR